MAASLFGVGNTVNANATGTVVPQSFTGTAAQTLFTLTNFTYTPGTNSLSVFINGQRQTVGRDFTETSTTTFTLTEGVIAGDYVDVLGFPYTTVTAVTAGSVTTGGGYSLASWMTDVNIDVCAFPYLAKGDGVTDDSAAINAAWQALKFTGGTLLFPPKAFYCNATLLFDVDQTAPHNYRVLGYGATILSGPAVTNFSVQVYKGYNNFGVTIEGLAFNHRGNTTVNGCIQSQGASNIKVLNCSMEAHNTKSTYAAIELGPYTLGDGNTNTFWARIDGFKTRIRSGGDGSIAAVGVRLKGAANATIITNCAFQNVTDAIRFENDGVVAGLANAVRIIHNDFEGVVNAITIAPTALDVGFITGLQVAFNRVEASTTFFNITGAAKNNVGYPPSLFNNYLTVGSVTNYLVNPNSQYIFSYEPSFFGVGARNFIGGPAQLSLIAEGVGNNVVISNLSNGSAWNSAHLVLGAYHIWVDNATGKLYIKGGVPVSATDGTVVGTQV